MATYGHKLCHCRLSHPSSWITQTTPVTFPILYLVIERVAERSVCMNAKTQARDLSVPQLVVLSYSTFKV